jgi:hypothetical protein
MTRTSAIALLLSLVVAVTAAPARSEEPATQPSLQP